MLYKLPTLKDAKVAGKTVFFRADLDVPVFKGKVKDDIRLNAWFPTLEYLLNKRAKVIIAGHIGRPVQKDIGSKKFSLEPVALWLSQKSKKKPKKIRLDGFIAWQFADNLLLLENLRFYKGEEENDKGFSQKLADLAEIYVNDAFAVSHRNHASVVGVPRLLPHFAGFRLEKEVEVLGKVLEEPQRPLTAIVGGAKIETKLPLIKKMHNFADYVLIGGKIADETKELFKMQKERKGRKSVLLIADLNSSGRDITEESLSNFTQLINVSKTIFWNGPMGKDETVDSSTLKLAQAVVGSQAYSIVGGGDTLDFLDKGRLLNKFSFYSIGGGSMLSFLSGEKLPGIEALIN